MRRIIAIVFASLAAFAIGALAYDVTHPPVAEASGGGGGAAACVQGTGSLVCATSPTLTTPNIGVATGTSLTLSQGVSAVTGVFSGAISSVSPVFTTPNIGAATGTSLNLGAQTTNGLTWSSGTAATRGLNLTCSNAAGGNNCIYAEVSSGTGTGIYVQGSGSGAKVMGASTGAGLGVRATNTSTGNALSAEATGSGYALQLVSDTTSPAKGHISMTAGDTNPTSCQVGDLFMFTGGVLRVCTDTTPTWVNVGSQ